MSMETILMPYCISCHPHNQKFKGQGTCLTCHNSTQAITVGPASGSTRREIVSEFSRTWSHKRSASGAVTIWDCIVCHMEGDPATGETSAASLYPDSKPTKLDDEALCALEVATGRADAFLYDRFSILRHHAKYADVTRVIDALPGQEPYAVCFRPGEIDLPFSLWTTAALAAFELGRRGWRCNGHCCLLIHGHGCISGPSSWLGCSSSLTCSSPSC